MFNTTKATIYSKLEDEIIRDEVVNTKKGKQLTVAGLSKLQLIMSESRVAYKENKVTNTINSEYNYHNEYINNLKIQLEELKIDKEKLIEDKEKLFAELNCKNEQIQIQQFQIKDLITNNNMLLLEEKKNTETKKNKDFKSILNFWKK